MPTPKKGYRTADGTKVPGATTVISALGWNKGPLMYWAWNEGREGRDFRETKETAADIGTLAHAMVEAKIHGLPFDVTGVEPALLSQAQSSFDAYCQWAETSRLEILETEMHLVSEVNRFGGTPDAIGSFAGGGLLLLDWKTSKAVYGDYVIQLAAYHHLWDETHPTDLLEDGAHLCRFGKQGGFAHHYFTQEQLDKGWDAFVLLRQLYDLRKPLEAAA